MLARGVRRHRHFLSLSSTNASPLLRLLSSSLKHRDAANKPAAQPSPDDGDVPPINRLAVDFLTGRCNLSENEALKAVSKHLAHLKSTANPDAVLAFLRLVGLSDADIAASVATSPRILCCKVDKTLAPIVAELERLGFSSVQIARLFVLAPDVFRSRCFIRKAPSLLQLYAGSVDTLLRVAKKNHCILSVSFERVVLPNLELLVECGGTARSFARLTKNRLITRSSNAIRAVLSRARRLGVPPRSVTFSRAVEIISGMSQTTIKSKLATMKSLGWSKAETIFMIRRFPQMLELSSQKLHKAVDFLVNTAGLDLQYVAHNPALLTYSVEQRLIPRYCVMKVLWERRLSKVSFAQAMYKRNEKFVLAFVRPHEQIIPGLAIAYGAALAGKTPAEIEVLLNSKK